VKLKMLAVVTLLVLGCSFASAQTFGFASVGSALQYCNYEQLFNYGSGVYAGIDNLSACGVYNVFAVNGAISGFGATLPAGDGLPVKGAGVDYGSSQIIAFYADLYGELVNDMWDVHSGLKCNKYNSKTGLYKGAYSWIGFAGSSFGGLVGENYGFLTCSIPGKGDARIMQNGPTSGKASQAMRSKATRTLNK